MRAVSVLAAFTIAALLVGGAVPAIAQEPDPTSRQDVVQEEQRSLRCARTSRPKGSG